MATSFKPILAAQFEASLRMLHDCIRQCPPEHWDSLIAKYPFWMVAYHTLCFVDLYLSPGEAVWQPRTGEGSGGVGGLHPLGWAELNDEYPSRRFSQAELLGYVEICRRMLGVVLGDNDGAASKEASRAQPETDESLEGPSGFSRLPFSRAELHLYNIRHIQHHTGQLSAFLRRVGVDTKWARSGWGKEES